jgi:hypothetical protein
MPATIVMAATPRGCILRKGCHGDDHSNKKRKSAHHLPRLFTSYEWSFAAALPRPQLGSERRNWDHAPKGCLKLPMKLGPQPSIGIVRRLVRGPNGSLQTCRWWARNLDAPSPDRLHGLSPEVKASIDRRLIPLDLHIIRRARRGDRRFNTAGDHAGHARWVGYGGLI